jgi:hypothetical protein
MKKYFKVENIIAIIGILLPYILKLVIPKFINDFLEFHKLNGVLVFVFCSFFLFTFLTTIVYFWDKRSRILFLKKINGCLIKLDAPVEVPYTSPFIKNTTIKRVYNSEIIKTFSEYNQILNDLKRKWPKKFNDLEFLANSLNIPQGDWVEESELNGVRIAFLQLKERI